MNQFEDLMVDVECAGTSETGALMALGAVFFNWPTCTLGPTFFRTIHLATSVRDGGTMDASTILWWLRAGDDARKSVAYNGEDVRLVLQEFRDWIGASCRHEDVRPWGNSNTFDLPKVETACARGGVEAPWYWTNCRDFRTVRNLYSRVEYDPAKKGDGAHNALTDAIFQVEHLFAIKREYRP